MEELPSAEADFISEMMGAVDTEKFVVQDYELLTSAGRVRETPMAASGPGINLFLPQPRRPAGAAFPNPAIRFRQNIPPGAGMELGRNPGRRFMGDRLLEAERHGTAGSNDGRIEPGGPRLGND